MYILGIDVGSSFLKSSVLDLAGLRVLESDSAPTPAFAPLSPERKEIPVDLLAKEIAGLIDRAAEKYPLEGVVFSVQMHGFMLFDKAGNAVTNYVSWQDMRGMIPDENGVTLLDWLKKEIPADLLRENGVNLRQNHSLLPLYHYLKEHPDTKDVEFAMIGDALTRILTGQRVSIHPTQAASSGLYSLEKEEWNWELIRWLGMSAIDFPPVSEAKEALATYRAANGSEIPVYTALGDHQATVLGICAGEGDVFVNIGTGGQIGYVAAETEMGAYETRPFFQGRTIRAFTQLPSGRSLNVLMGFVMDLGRQVFGSDMKEKDVWKRLDALTGAEDACAEGLQVDFAFFDAVGGGISGVHGDNFTAKNLFYGAYESMAAAYVDRSKGLLTAGSDLSGVVCTGGVVRKNPILLRCIGEQFGVPCRLAPWSDDTMVGLLRYALWCRKDAPLFGETFRLGE